jgi:hypothetical protein
MRITENDLLDLLPTGSGINCDWQIKNKGSYFRAENSFATYNSVGYLVGYADFYLTIPKRDPLSFKFHFIGGRAQDLNKRYYLRDYLEDTIYYSLEEWRNHVLSNNDKM